MVENAHVDIVVKHKRHRVHREVPPCLFNIQHKDQLLVVEEEEGM